MTMKNTTLQTEILDYLNNIGDIKSPRVYQMYQAIQYAESNTDMCRILTKTFINLDEDLTNLTNELIGCRATSTYIKPMFVLP